MRGEGRVNIAGHTRLGSDQGKVQNDRGTYQTLIAAVQIGVGDEFLDSYVSMSARARAAMQISGPVLPQVKAPQGTTYHPESS